MIVIGSQVMDARLDAKKAAFKQYDIRGSYPDLVDESLVEIVSRALGEKLFRTGKVVLGMDGRISSPSLLNAAKKGLMSIGDIEIEEVGLMTTPMLAFLVNHLGAIGGIMITASHNPKEDNGMKVANSSGEPIGGEEILKLL